MQVTNSNNVKIYNLSCGKSLPEWISERKRRLLQKKDVGVRQRIELIQDFEMPHVSNNVKISGDGKFIFSTGIYKPRIRCYDVDNLSMKFERCYDAEAVQFETISDDYSKFIILQNDRNVEFHDRRGCLAKKRIPKSGRDMTYHQNSAELLLVGSSSEIYRYNLEEGRFMKPYETDASSINKIVMHKKLDLIAYGTVEGRVEFWDPRMKMKVGVLDCGLSCVTENTVVQGFPSVTSLWFQEGLTLGAGTYTGQILLYDIRTNKPFIVKDHMYGLPIKNIDLIENEDLVVSVDQKCVKFWEKNSGKPYTTIQSPVHLNDLCLVKNTGLLFLANEDKKILTYFIPSIGPAPQWCSFLDSITEELEESKENVVYDDYKFVTKKELEELHLDHLQGTNLLRAYMHGFFIDIRLYNKAKAIVQPTAYKDLKKKMIREKIEKERKNKIEVKKLPAVNKELAQKLQEMKGTTKYKEISTILDDPRFKDTFENPDFEIDEKNENAQKLKSVIEKLNKKKKSTEPESGEIYEQMDIVQEEEHKINNEYTSSEEDESEDDEESDDEESDTSLDDTRPEKKPKQMFEAVDAERFSMLKKDDDDDADNTVPIAERLKNTHQSIKHNESSGGNKVVTFTLKKEEKISKREEERKSHLKERAKYRRPAKYLPRK